MDLDQAFYHVKLRSDGFISLCTIFKSLYLNERYIYNMRSDDVHMFLNFLGEMDQSMLDTWEQELHVVIHHINNFRNEVRDMCNKMIKVLEFTDSIDLFDRITKIILNLKYKDIIYLKNHIDDFNKEFDKIVGVLSDKYRDIINMMDIANDNFERLSVMMGSIHVDMFRLYTDADDYKINKNSLLGG